MFGIVVLLCTSCTNVFQLCIQFCISLAVGSLTGDALLHLIPMVSETFKAATKYSFSFILELKDNHGDFCCGLCVQFLDLHVHSHNTNSQKQSQDGQQEEIPDYIYKILVLIAGIYYFYLMETIFSLIVYKDNHHHHQHHHGVREKNTIPI